MNLATATLFKGPIGIYFRYSGTCSSLSIAQKMIHTTTSGLHPPSKKSSNPVEVLREMVDFLGKYFSRKIEVVIKEISSEK